MQNRGKNASQPDGPVVFSGSYTCFINTKYREKNEAQARRQLNYLQQLKILKEMLSIRKINNYSYNSFSQRVTDGGQTFSTPVNISNNPGYSNEPINVNDILYESSIIIIDNNVYVSWTDGTPAIGKFY